MHIGVVHTDGSPCGCAEAVAVGLKALGHDAIIVNSEEIEFTAAELAGKCDLVIDHTDTFRGRGLFRAFVRLMLEGHGARLVGSGAQACFTADDKIASKSCLDRAGIVTPPGIVIGSKQWRLPPWLRFPLVLKPAFEHMSRGVAVAETVREARSKSAHMLKQFQQPIIAESYISGRELAVSVLEGPRGLEILPPLEWKLGEQRHGFLTEDFKLEEPAEERQDAVRAVLSDELLNQLENYVRQAFRTLQLRDYARFDLKLSPGGTFYFLEANVTPSLEPLEAFALSAQWAGLSYSSLVDRMLSAALDRYGDSTEVGEATITLGLPTGPLKLLIPRGVHTPPPSTLQLAGLLDIQAGERVMELGCGTGILSIVAAKLGAKRVVAVDINTKALETTVHNVRLNGVEKQIETRFGTWYELLGKESTASDKKEQYDVIIATPPQTPGPYPFGPRYGGADGTQHLFAVIDGAQAFLSPQRGRFWLLAISLANPKAVFDRLKMRFHNVTLVCRTGRTFSSDEYESIEEGLFQYLLRLRSHGAAEFEDIDNTHYMFYNYFIRASEPKS
ncbi:MAG: 50S ribosomal protein L11 methyltransferase [Syntrophorhabdus sp.]